MFKGFSVKFHGVDDVFPCPRMYKCTHTSFSCNVFIFFYEGLVAGRGWRRCSSIFLTSHSSILLTSHMVRTCARSARIDCSMMFWSWGVLWSLARRLLRLCARWDISPVPFASEPALGSHLLRMCVWRRHSTLCALPRARRGASGARLACIGACSAGDIG